MDIHHSSMRSDEYLSYTIKPRHHTTDRPICNVLFQLPSRFQQVVTFVI